MHFRRMFGTTTTSLATSQRKQTPSDSHLTMLSVEEAYIQEEKKMTTTKQVFPFVGQPPAFLCGASTLLKKKV